MLYYDTESNETKGVVDLTSASITRGPEEHKQKCLKKFSSSSTNESLERRVMSSFSLLLITGHDNTNTQKEEVEVKKQRFELVFNTVREAKMFTFAVYSADKNADILVCCIHNRCR